MPTTSPSATACLQRAWDVMTKNFGLAVGVSALNMVVSSVASSTGLGIVIYGPLRGGLARFCLKLLRGEQATVNDSFSGFSIQLVPLIIGGLLAMIGIFIGSIFCIIPGLYLGLAWLFAETLIIEKGLDFWPAMELSRQTFHQHMGFIITLAVLQFGVIVLGSLACGIGLFIAYPLVVLSSAAAYEALFNAGTPSLQAPQMSNVP